jgi:membrane-bound serine protease (ClpP class)
LPEQPGLAEPDTKPEAGADSRVLQHDGKAGNEDKLPIGDTMSRKAVHDAAAYIRSLAQLRGRNADWAERAVREAVSLSATEALNLKVIDYVAADVPELLKQVNNRKVSVLGRVLQTLTSIASDKSNTVVFPVSMDLMSMLTNALKTRGFRGTG